MKRKVLKITKNKYLQENVVEIKPVKSIRVSQNKFLEMLSFASGLGFSISIPIAGGAFMGHFLDNKFHSSPVLTLLLIFLGLFIGFIKVCFVIYKLAER